jgi:hypothetical protein
MLGSVLLVAAVFGPLSACGSGGAMGARSGLAQLAVSPAENFTVVGSAAIGWLPASKTYEVTNQGDAAMSWGIQDYATWLTVTPAEGELQPSQSLTVTVAVNAAANSLPAGNHASSLAFRNLSNGLGETTLSAFLTVTPPASSSMTAASRTSGVAPLAVAFDATGVASGVLQPEGSTPDFASFCYEWDYGDQGSGSWAYNGKSRNTSTGWIGAHVYETPGTYRARLRVTDAAGDTHDYHQDIVVTDPSTVFGSRTFYVAANGSDANPGTQASPFQSIQRGLQAAFSSGQPGRLLFRRGDAFTSSVPQSLPSGNVAGLIGAYGTGARPRLQWAGAEGGINLGARRDVRLVDLDLVSTASSMLSYARGVTMGTESTLLRCKVEAFGYAIDMTNVNSATVCDCEILNNVEYGIWAYSPDLVTGNRIAVLGTRLNVAGYHLTRVYINRSIFMANRYETGGFTAMAWVGRTAGSPPTQLNCIVDNHYTTETLDVVAMGPANSSFNEYAQDFLFEGNHFYSRNSSGSCLKIRGSRVTIRNNVFDLAGRHAVVVEQWGGSPVPLPSNVRIEHNTAYRGSGSPLRFAQVSSANPTVVRSNLTYCVQGTAESPTGTVTASQNLTQNPLFVDAPGGNFRLNAGSPALDAATGSAVRTDHARNPRPSGAADIGAFERQN